MPGDREGKKVSIWAWPALSWLAFACVVAIGLGVSALLIAILWKVIMRVIVGDCC